MIIKFTGRLSLSNFGFLFCLGVGCEKNGIDREFLRCFIDGISIIGGIRSNRDLRRFICMVIKEIYNIE